MVFNFYFFLDVLFCFFGRFVLRIIVFKEKEGKNVRGGANGKVNPMQAAEKK